jgi:hypothetical protein
MNEDPKPRGGRRANGTFAKGVSGNPGGRLAGFGDFVRLAREEGPANIAKCKALRDDPKVPPAVQLNAVKELNDRAYGKPFVPVFQGGMGAMDMFAEPGADGGVSTPLLRSAKHSEQEREVRKRQIDEAREDMRNGVPVPDQLRLLVAVRDEPE